MNQRSHTHPLQQLHLLQQPSSYLSLIYLATALQRLLQQRYCQSWQHISRKRFRQWLHPGRGKHPEWRGTALLLLPLDAGKSSYLR